MTQATSQKRGIQMTDSAVRQVLALREKQGKDLDSSHFTKAGNSNDGLCCPSSFSSSRETR